MPVLALAITTADKLRAIPADFWLRLGTAVVAVVALVVFLRFVAHMNKVLLGITVFFVVTVVGFNWIYERNEPAWATPVIAPLAGFFPTKIPVPSASPAKPVLAVATRP